MARDRKVPALGTKTAPFELGFERNAMYFSLGRGGEREFQVEEMAGKQSLESMKQIGLYSTWLEYSCSKQQEEVEGMPVNDLIKWVLEGL